MRIDEVDWIELIAAVVALAPPRIGKTADWAFAFYVAVGQSASADRVEGAHLRGLDKVALLEKVEKQLLGDPVMVCGRGSA